MTMCAKFNESTMTCLIIGTSQSNAMPGTLQSSWLFIKLKYFHLKKIFYSRGWVVKSKFSAKIWTDIFIFLHKLYDTRNSLLK